MENKMQNFLEFIFFWECKILKQDFFSKKFIVDNHLVYLLREDEQHFYKSYFIIKLKNLFLDK